MCQKSLVLPNAAGSALRVWGLVSSFWETTETFWRWKRIVLTEHCAVCPLRLRRTDCCSLPITLGFALALGRNCSLSHLLIQSECAFLPQGIHQGIIEGDFALCISLYHGYELLLQMGIRSLFIYLWGIMDGAKGEMSFLPAPLLSHLARCMAERMRVDLVFCSLHSSVWGSKGNPDLSHLSPKVCPAPRTSWGVTRTSWSSTSSCRTRSQTLLWLLRVQVFARAQQVRIPLWGTE